MARPATPRDETPRRAYDAAPVVVVTGASGGLGRATAMAFARDGWHIQPFEASGRHVVTPTYVPHLADGLLDLLIDDETGIWHLTSGAEMSWAAFAQAAASASGHDPALVRAVPGPEADGACISAALTTTRGVVLPPFCDALGDFVSRLDSRLLDTRVLDSGVRPRPTVDERAECPALHLAAPR